MPKVKNAHVNINIHMMQIFKKNAHDNAYIIVGAVTKLYSIVYLVRQIFFFFAIISFEKEK